MPAIHNLLGTASPVPHLPLAALTTNWVALPDQPPALLHLDCSAPPYQCPQGVCHQISQLLLLRRAGVEVWLHQVHPLLAHSLHQLKVASLFTWGA